MEHTNSLYSNRYLLLCLLVIMVAMRGTPVHAAEAEKIGGTKGEVKEEKSPERRSNKASAFTVEVINYSELTHTIALAKLRAGNHDPSGLNHYYFTANIYALLVNKEEKKLEFPARKKITRPLGNFAEIEIRALSPWQKDEKDSTKNSLQVDGDMIRSITSEAMRKFASRESEIAIKVDVLMMEKAKKFYFLGQDTLIGTVSFYPIPETIPRQANKENILLNITDDLGTNADITVKFKTSEKSTQKK